MKQLLTKLLFILIMPVLFFVQSAMADATWFITKWQTTAANETIIIPVQTSLTYNYDIDCDNDNTFEQTGVTGDGTCTYVTAGDHIINIQGTFPAIYISNGSMKTKILDVMQWGNIAWESMNRAFYGASNLQITATDSPVLSNVTGMSQMFYYASSFNQDLSGWDVSNVTNMYSMFSKATAFDQDISNWNVSNVTDMSYMFSSTGAFNQDISTWDVSNVTNMSFMFSVVSAFNQDLSGWDVSNVTNMSQMFRGASSFNSDIGSWDVSNVTNMSYMFLGTGAFNQDISTWNVSNVTSMSSIFHDANAFNQDISTWNVSNVTDMGSMFSATGAFNQNISTWNVSNVTDMSYMFYDANAFNQDLSGWDVSNVTNMISMFGITSAFNQDLSGWNVSNVTNMDSMFYDANTFNQNIGSWNVSNVTNMISMFYEANAFNQDLSGWNVSNVTDMSYMFSSASAFNQDLSGWDVSNVTDMTYMFDGVTLSTANYDALLEGWNNLTLQSGISFHGGDSKYTAGSAAETARTNMTSSDSWTITDGGTILGQTITFTNPGNKTFIDTLTLAATSDSGLSVSYTSTTTPVCTVNSNTGAVTFISDGQCSIIASQAGDATYAPATDVSQTFAITKFPTTTTITSNTPNPSEIGDTITINFTVTPSSGSNPSGDVTITDGTNSCVATLPESSCNIIFNSSGTKSLTATYTGDTNFNGSLSSTTNHTVENNEIPISEPIVKYQLIVNKTGNGTITASYGINCGNDCDQDFADQTEISLIATPDENWLFDKWTGDCDKAGKVRINSDKTCTANFIQQHTLTTNVEGQGTVNGCGTSCTQVYLAGETVNLTTSAEGIWALDNWSGDCDANGNVTMDSDKTCTATFVEGYTLKINIGTGKGKVKTITKECKEDCEEIVAADLTTTLIAEPEIEWVLDSFSGDCDAKGKVEMTGEKACTANFIKDPNIPNNGDGNGDGIHDADQPNVVSMPDKSSGKYLTLDISESVKVKEIYTDLAENQDYFEERYVFPQGLVYFELEGTEADITIYYHSLTELRATPMFQKFGTKVPGDMNTLGWYVLPNVKFDTVAVGNKSVVTASYHLTDGELGDSTGVDGRIVDPGGLAFDSDFDNIISFTSKDEAISIQNPTADIIVSRSGIKGSLTVNYATTNSTAVSGQDYQTTNGTLNWQQNDRSDKTISIPILNDASSGEILQVKLSNLTSDFNSVLGIDTTSITFNNEDIATPIIPEIPVESDTSLSFSSRGYSAFKTETTATITINRIGTQGVVTVDYNTIDGTAIAGQDYQTTSGSLTWAAGDNSPKTFTVTMLASATLGDSLLLSLSNADNAQLNIDTAILTILEILDVLEAVDTTQTITDIESGDVLKNVNIEGEVVNEGTLCNATIQVLSSVEGGNLDCNILNQGTVEDVTINRGAVVEGGYVAGEVDNNGDLANVTINKEAIVTGGNVTGIVKNEGTLQDVTVDASVAGGNYAGETINKGLVSNATVNAGATLTGGTITGSSINNGTMGDITISPYAEVQGGEFTGDIVNKGTMTNVKLLPGATITGGILDGNITSEGTIKDVELAEGMQVLGGTLAGKIAGDPEAPAQIGAATIESGAVLSYVRLSPTTVIADGVKFGPGVIIPEDYANPVPEDFGLASDGIAELQTDDIANLEPEVFATLQEEQIAEIPVEAFVAIEAEQLSQFAEESVAVISPEQFAEMPVEALAGLDAETIDDLSVAVLDKFTPEHLDNLNSEEFQKMPSEDVSKLFVNVDIASIDSRDMAQLIPDGWDLDLQTGEFIAPIGAKITPRNLPSSPTNMPAIPDMHSGIGVGGAGIPLLESATNSLEEEDLTDFILSQDDNGILNVTGTGDSAGKVYTFIPDADNVIQVDTEEIPIGLEVGAGGFYTVTTPEGQQYKVIPAPKDPVLLAEVTGSEIEMGKRGDVLIKPSNRTRSSEAYEVMIFDPFVEPDMDNLCIEIFPGEFECDDENLRRSSRAKTRKIQYPDGTAQTVKPTVLSPDVFIEIALKFEGVEQVVYKADGTFAVLYQGKPYFIVPDFIVKNKPISKEVEPSIVPNEKGSIKYSIAIEAETNTRSSESYEVLTFDPFIEAAPDDLCIEIFPGEFECDF